MTNKTSQSGPLTRRAKPLSKPLPYVPPAVPDAKQRAANDDLFKDEKEELTANA